MDEYLTDQQQADIVRRWLRENGTFLLGGLVIGLGALFGWNQWQDYKAAQAGLASALYEDIMVAIRANRTSQAEDLIASLQNDYGSTPYLDQSRLMMAKSYMDRSEFEVAATYLGEVVSGSKSAEMRHIARLRLARIRLQQEQPDAALSLVEEVYPESAFAPRYHDLRGDIFVAMNRPAEARAEFTTAMELAGQPPVIDRAYVQAKLDDLGELKVPSLDDIDLDVTAGEFPSDEDDDESPAEAASDD